MEHGTYGGGMPQLRKNISLQVTSHKEIQLSQRLRRNKTLQEAGWMECGHHTYESLRMYKGYGHLPCIWDAGREAVENGWKSLIE